MTNNPVDYIIKNTDKSVCYLREHKRMSNIIRKTTELAMYIASAYTFPGCVIIDATCGNGHDTLALAEAQPSKLYGFDIQQQAVDNTINLLKANGHENRLDNGTISIICVSHSNMQKHVNEPADLIVFNLGYLPGGDKSITTSADETIQAIQTSLNLLNKDGLLCITMYSGHAEGLAEKEMLLEMARELDTKVYHVAYTSFPNQKKSPPEILMITKKRVPY